MTYYSAIKNEVLIYVTEKMNLNNIVKSKNPVTKKKHMFCGSIYMKYPELANIHRQKVDKWFPRDGQ